MKHSNEEYRNLIKEFKERWDLNRIKQMKLDEYSDIKNEETFCYWVERKTEVLGSIRGTPADKFGIFKRGLKSQNPNERNHYFDEEHIWRKSLGHKKKYEAFEEVKKRILKVIEHSINSDFENIENINLHNFFKWKIAYLFSNEKLFPGFEKEFLKFVLKELKYKSTEKLKIYEMQSMIMKKKPNNNTIYEFSHDLWDKFNKKIKKDIPNNDPALIGFEGGKGKKIKEHLAKERDSKFRNKYRKEFSYIKKCPACNMSSKNLYNIIDENKFLELHHIVPLKYVEQKTKITVEDVTLLCPNCHRAIHKIMNKEKKKKIILEEFKKNYLKQF